MVVEMRFARIIVEKKNRVGYVRDLPPLLMIKDWKSSIDNG